MCYLFLLLQQIYYRLKNYFKPTKYYKQNNKNAEEIFIPYTNPNKKPKWVKEKVIYLKVHLPNDGCRKVAVAFNRIYAHKKITVSKSYVYSVIKANGYKIIKRRRELKHNIPKQLPKNIQWSMDLTTINKQQIFGVVDSGSRALLTLKHLPTKSTINIIRTLIDTIELYGKPKIIKSDNEIVFTSKLIRFTLWLLGIKQQTTQIASPWQNGRIERLFGTMKQSFQDLVFPTSKSLQDGLKEFRFFYNHIRTHQNLQGRTPSETWDNKNMATSKTHREILYYQGLCNNVSGFYFME